MTVEDRFFRQEILSGVGKEGQAKWAQARVLLAGDGPALKSAVLGLASSGIHQIILLSKAPFDGSSLTEQFPQLRLELLREAPGTLPSVSLGMVLSEDPAFRRAMSRSFRRQAQSALFGWPAASGFALMAVEHQDGQCPCLECFEVMNPKAFTQGTPAIQEMTGALAATEALLWILKGGTPLTGKVWINALGAGVSVQHAVHPTYKCAARMAEEGAVVTP